MNKNHMKILIPVAAVSTLIFLFLCACTIKVRNQSNTGTYAGQDIGLVREDSEASDNSDIDEIDEFEGDMYKDTESSSDKSLEANENDNSDVEEDIEADKSENDLIDVDAEHAEEDAEDSDDNIPDDNAIIDNTEQSDTGEEGQYSGEYIIYVNRDQNVVRVNRIAPSGKETPDKVFTCSCGRLGHATPKGTFKTSDKYDWRLMVDGTYARYCVRFNGKILFHSVPYYTESDDNLEWEQYNLLGQNASLGCVRLAVKDAKWIYDNCGKGTTVVVYTDAEDPTPLEKPETIFISPMSENKGWDPTDDSPFSPWNNEVIR